MELDAKIKRLVLGGILTSFLCGIGLPSVHATVIFKNEATGSVGGVPLSLSKATVEFRYLSGNAVSLAVAEITPNSITTSRAGFAFEYFILPTINPGDTGIDQVTIIIPPGYANMAVTAVMIGQAAQTAQCSTPAAGQYCFTRSEQVATLKLGTPVTTTQTTIKITFTADTPATFQNAEFISTVDDTRTPAIAQTTIGGDANGDPSDDNGIGVFVSNAADPDFSTIVAEPRIVLSDGMASSTITTTLMDKDQQMLPRKRIENGTDRNNTAKTVGKTAPLFLPDAVMQPALPTDTNGVATGFVRSTRPGITIVTGTDLTDQVALAKTAEVFFTQGLKLRLTKSANKRSGSIGEVISYLVEIRNTTATDVTDVKIEDHLPPPFKYLAGSTLFKDQPFPDPVGNTTRVFDIGVIPAMQDQNGNGQSDPGEPGYVTLRYQLIIGSAAKPTLYRNTAVAKDVLECDGCIISNQTEASVEVTLDPLFDLGTIIGKVFIDKNEDGLQDSGEAGIGGVVVALDEGTYAVTDAHGLYHLPGITPGERLIKINKQTLPHGGSLTTQERQMVHVTRGGLAKVNFGVVAKSTAEIHNEGSQQESSFDLLSIFNEAPAKSGRGVPHPDVAPDGSSLPTQDNPSNGNGKERKNLFLMALADGELGHLSTSGNLKMAGLDEHKKYYEKGRIAFYLKGMIQGKYLVTSALDTRKNRFNRMFTDLDDEETDRFVTHLDPDKFYPIYGDDSAVVYDAQAQGKFYLAVDSDEIHAIIGNYPTQINDTELASINRTLYGGRFEYKSLAQTVYGDPNTRVILFGAEVRQAHAENILRATGGSLYYLSEKNILDGSEQVRIEIRDKETGLVLAQIPKTRDIDYTIKYEEGRILFNLPISSVVDNALVIHQPGLHGDPVFIVVDFEYTVNDFQKATGGVRIKQQINDYLAIGGTSVKDGESASDYTLSGGDLTLRLGSGTTMVGEMAGSEGNSLSSLQSDNGGLTYQSLPVSAGAQGEAYKIAGRLDLADLDLSRFGYEKPFEKDQLVTQSYYKKLEPHFVSNGTRIEQGTIKYGGWIQYKLNPQDTLSVRSDLQEIIASSTPNRTRLKETTFTHTEGPFTVSTAFQERVMEQSMTSLRQDTLAGRLGWKVDDRLTTTFGHQDTLKGPSNRQTTAEMTYQLTPTWTAIASGMDGHNQQGALVGLSANLDLGSRVYLHQRLTRANGQPDLWGSVVGGERMITDKTRLYTEYERDHGSLEQYRQLWGVDQSWLKPGPLRVHFHFEQSAIQGPLGKTGQNALGIGSHYHGARSLMLSDRIEVRMEEGTERLQWLTAHNGKLKVQDNLTFMAKLNYSKTGDKLNPIEARFKEVGLGAAYRPVAFDRLNGLAKYTHLSDRRPDPLHAVVETSADIGAVEGLYDITPHVQWMEKVAVKVSENRQAPHRGVKSQTRLWINRMNYHITTAWDAAVEYRILQQRQANDRLDGFLVEVDRDMGEYARLGIGYNFSRFSDNLFFENNYDARGVFIRAQAFF